MAKNRIFILLFLSFGLLHPVKVDAKTPFNGIIPENVNCQAPPPDSFRVTVAGGNFITLAWAPAWNGATHTLVVFLKNEDDNSWQPIDTFHQVSGSSFTYTGITPPVTRYGFSISTECNNGETSSENDFVTPPIGVILDLTIEGRYPTNPAPKTPCTEIKYENHDWVGFYVKKNYGEYQPHNFFEVTVEDDHPVVKRTILESPVVAGTVTYLYPKNPPNDHVYFYDYPKFFMFEDLGNNQYEDIGWLSISLGQIGSDKYMKICKEGLAGWNNGYNFMTFVSLPPDNFSNNHDRNDTATNNQILVQTTVTERLIIGHSRNLDDHLSANIMIWSISGYILVNREMEVSEKNIEVFVGDLPQGFYISKIKIGNLEKTFKFIKV